jgi:hypothetical protein
VAYKIRVNYARLKSRRYNFNGNDYGNRKSRARSGRATNCKPYTAPLKAAATNSTANRMQGAGVTPALRGCALVGGFEGAEAAF